MLINLSNHPSIKWGEAQKAAASVYGEIKELPFPQISPEWNTEEVEAKAYTFYLDCVELLEKEKSPSAIHLAGEPIFCFLLAQMLLRAGYRCLTSTTKRKVIEVGDTKTSEFQFVGFREYKWITL